MTFLTSLHRIAPIAHTARRAAKPAIYSAFTAGQQRFNSSGAVEVTKGKKDGKFKKEKKKKHVTKKERKYTKNKLI